MAEECLNAVYHLATVEPHQRRDARYGHAEWVIYAEGYYCALAFALRAIEFRLQRLREREERRRAL